MLRDGHSARTQSSIAECQVVSGPRQGPGEKSLGADNRRWVAARHRRTCSRCGRGRGVLTCGWAAVADAGCSAMAIVLGRNPPLLNVRSFQVHAKARARRVWAQTTAAGLRHAIEEHVLDADVVVEC